MANTVNSYFDVVIIGASFSGIATAKSLSKRSDKSICIISKAFSENLDFDKERIKTITGEALFIAYKRGLMGIVVAPETQPKIFCTQLVIATGTHDYDFMNKPAGVYKNIIEVPKEAVKNVCVVCGESAFAQRQALLASHSYRKVYYCSNRVTFKDSHKKRIKLLEERGVVILPGTTLSKIYSADNILTSIKLDTGSNITCDTLILAKNIPDTEWLRTQVACDDEGYLVVNKDCQSTQIPIVYGAGEVVKNFNWPAHNRLINCIINQTIGGAYYVNRTSK